MAERVTSGDTFNSEHVPGGSRTSLLAVGPRGLPVTVPDGVQLLPMAQPIEAGEALPAAEQQRIIKAALDTPEAGPPLRELAKGHRRAVVVAGGLALPAPYDIALPPVVAALLEAEIRPTRIAILAWPGASGPVLGCAAIHRYGEELTGEYELRAWQAGGTEANEPDALYAAADLRIVVTPALTSGDTFNSEHVPDLAVVLGLGRKPTLDIVSARAGSVASGDTFTSEHVPAGDHDVLLTSGGGADWETTLEEALLSLHHATPPAVEPGGPGPTAVLAFSGQAGLGSAHFTLDLWSLLQQAEEILASGQTVAGLAPRPAEFDPAATVAAALSSWRHVTLFSPGLAEHEEGADFAEKLAGLPGLAQHVRLCAHESELWELLAAWHGGSYRLRVAPLGWRALCGR